MGFPELERRREARRLARRARARRRRTVAAGSLVARQILRRRYGVPVNWFCYPSGHYNATVIAASYP